MKIFVFLFCVFYFVSCSYPEILSNPGTAGANFLKINLSARAEGLAQNFCGLSDDPSAIYFNPAGIAQIREKKLQMNHITWYEDVYADNVVFVIPVLSIATIGFDYRTLLGEDYVRTLENDIVIQKDKIILSDTAFSVSFAMKFSVGEFKEDNLYFGATGKYIDEKLFNNENYSYACDFGILYDYKKMNSMYGISLQNIGPNIGEYILPWTLRIGTSYKSNDYLISWEISQGIDTRTRAGFGVELKTSDIVVLRIGGFYQSDQLSYTLGLGINTGYFEFDYAYAKHPDGNLSELGFVSNKVSLTLKFNKF
jgi:hypothetical protein